MAHITSPKMTKRHSDMNKLARRKQKDLVNRHNSDLVPSMTRKNKREALKERLLHALSRQAED
jgi:hypothetical protein